MDLLAVKARGLGFYGPLLLIALMTLAVVFSPLPSAPVALAAGAVYGHTYGTIYIVIGAEVGAIVDNEGEQYIAATDQACFIAMITGIHGWAMKDLVAYIKSLWSKRELDCQGQKHMQCMQ